MINSPEYSSKIMADGSNGVSWEETSLSWSDSSWASSSALVLTENVTAPIKHMCRISHKPGSTLKWSIVSDITVSMALKFKLIKF